MPHKKVRIKLVPMQGTLTWLSAKVEGVVAVTTAGTKAEATVHAARTDVEIEARGTPQATFLCDIKAEYDDGKLQIISAQPLSLDMSGTYSRVFHIGAVPPPPAAAAPA